VSTWPQDPQTNFMLGSLAPPGPSTTASAGREMAKAPATAAPRSKGGRAAGLGNLAGKKPHESNGLTARCASTIMWPAPAWGESRRSARLMVETVASLTEKIESRCFLVIC
jgi:hypothetical protein